MHAPDRRHDDTSLYVHVPFCVVKCGYCDFNSYAIADVDAHRRFVAALDAELGGVAPPRTPATVFIGGGTPTYLGEAEFAAFFDVLARHVDLPGCAEVSMEANPESVTPAKARIAHAAGVRRASIGVQTFAPDGLRFLDRAHDADAVARAVDAFREAGFDNLSLDLIYGLPGQSLEAWDADLDRALALRPDHLSCYNLTFEPGTRLTRDLERGRVAPNDDAQDRRLFEHTHARLAAAGFWPYEVSNFAGRGGPCRHNDRYWLQHDYVGVGPGAASHRGGWRGTNLKPLDAWADAVERGLPGTGEAEWLDRPARVGEALWLGLRRRDGVDLRAIGARVGVSVETVVGAELDELVGSGRLEREGTVVRLAPDWLPFADVVGAAFLR